MEMRREVVIVLAVDPATKGAIASDRSESIGFGAEPGIAIDRARKETSRSQARCGRAP